MGVPSAGRCFVAGMFFLENPCQSLTTTNVATMKTSATKSNLRFFYIGRALSILLTIATASLFFFIAWGCRSLVKKKLDSASPDAKDSGQEVQISTNVHSDEEKSSAKILQSTIISKEKNDSTSDSTTNIASSVENTIITDDLNKSKSVTKDAESTSDSLQEKESTVVIQQLSEESSPTDTTINLNNSQPENKEDKTSSSSDNNSTIEYAAISNNDNINIDKSLENQKLYEKYFHSPIGPNGERRIPAYMSREVTEMEGYKVFGRGPRPEYPTNPDNPFDDPKIVNACSDAIEWLVNGGNK
jgi:hypothetical protein